MNTLKTISLIAAALASYAQAIQLARSTRQAAGTRSNMPVKFVDGGQPPTVKGRSYYWTTPSGKTEILYPSSYGWPMTYHHSTLRLEVGTQWQPGK